MLQKLSKEMLCSNGKTARNQREGWNCLEDSVIPMLQIVFLFSALEEVVGKKISGEYWNIVSSSEWKLGDHVSKDTDVIPFLKLGMSALIVPGSIEVLSGK